MDINLGRDIDLPVNRHSFFLFGPRQTGKTTLIKFLTEKYNTFYVNLLHFDEFIKYKSDVSALRNEIDFFIKKNKRCIVFIDEIQKLPELLDEIHSMIETYNKNIHFILTGSSARKLKRTSANLLAGRAWTYYLFPFNHIEMGGYFDLDTILQFGSLPPLLNLNKKEKIKTLEAYTETYLKEEIISEALIRNLSAFSRFLDIAADNSGEIINYSNIARETGIASKTVKEYYQILCDTLIAFQLEPYFKSMRKRATQHPKYYLFDTGVINSICGRLNINLKKNTYLYGKLFEHFIILEIYRLIRYYNKPYKLYFWRTYHGAEVDLVIEFSKKKVYAIEIKSSDNVKLSQLTGLKQFLIHYPKTKGFCICNIKKPYIKNCISFYPWKYFFEKELL